MITNQKWIRSGIRCEEGLCPVYRRLFSVSRSVREASLCITAKGVYDARLNGCQIGECILAPGFTQYNTRILYRTYDITSLLKCGENELTVTVGGGWYHGRFANFAGRYWEGDIIAELTVTYEDGTGIVIGTDEQFMCGLGQTCFSDLYDGEIYDATRKTVFSHAAAVCDDASTDILHEQESEGVAVYERLKPEAVLHTPCGETVLDFGKNIAGYVELSLCASAGDKIKLSFGEVLDANGNFYNENYRTAKCLYEYICKEGHQTYHPHLTYYGFRYVRIDEFPSGIPFSPAYFTAAAISSLGKPAMHIETGSRLLNRFLDAAVLGQRDNFIDTPTDCPQRDERRGWTGDALAFMKTAAYQFDVRAFFDKWMADFPWIVKRYGHIGYVVPDTWGEPTLSAAWSDIAVIGPWTMFQMYGDRQKLRERLPVMRAHVEYIKASTVIPDTWTAEKENTHFGDWLSPDAPAGTYRGSTRENFIASAFYAYDTELLIRAMETLGMDASEYRALHERIRARFAAEYPLYLTQTECVLALAFHLTQDTKAAAQALTDMIKANGGCLSTGFVGTPFLLYALSENGCCKEAYSLLLNEKCPSWLYMAANGATTVWEHWDGIRPDGTMCDPKMNSFNHYAFGAAASWVYEVAAGILPEEAGFRTVRIAPHPDRRLGRLSACFDSPCGRIAVSWAYHGDRIEYDVSVPTNAVIAITAHEERVPKGSYHYNEPAKD